MEQYDTLEEYTSTAKKIIAKYNSRSGMNNNFLPENAKLNANKVHSNLTCSSDFTENLTKNPSVHKC